LATGKLGYENVMHVLMGQVELELNRVKVYNI